MSGKIMTNTLSNGIRVVLIPDDSNPNVSVRMAFLGGKRYETKENEGIMNFIAQMLTKGTTKLSEVEIAAKVDDMGGRVGGFSGYDSFGLSATFFSRNFKEGLGLLADIYTGVSFPQDRLERERALILNRIKTQPDRPTPYTVDVLARVVFPDHPYGFVKEGTITTVAGFTSEDLKQTYAHFAVPSNMVLTVVGDMDPKEVLNQIEGTFGKVPARKLDVPAIPKEKPLKGVQEKVVRIPRAKAHLALGFIGSTLSDPDRYPLDVLNNILAGQGGRLFTQLRDKESLAYTVTSFVRPGMDPGVFAFYIACDEPKADRALQGLLEQINLIREKPVTDEELKRSVNNLIGEYLINLQSSGARAENTALNTLYGLGYDYDKEYVKKISAITAEDVLKAARKYLEPKNYAVVKILPDENQK
jgi:zinc protease